jgi:hypothetical protein
VNVEAASNGAASLFFVHQVPRPFGRRDSLLAALVGLVACLAFLPALRTGFVSDDFFILTRVRDLGGLSHPLAYFHLGFFEYYRPLAFLSQALDWNLWGLRAGGFHATNVAIHAVSAVLVFVLGRRLLARGWAVAAALLFALHPASHEAVYWVAARFDLLATAFALAAILLLGSDRPARRTAGLICFGLALLSKESAVAVPVLAAAWDVVIERRNWRSAAVRLAPLFAVLAAYAVLRGLGVDVAIAGGARRLPKLVMLAAALAGLVWLARRDGVARALAAFARTRAVTAGFWLASLAAALTAALAWPPTAAWVRDKLGFLAYAAFYLVSPVVLPPPPPYFLDATTPVYAIAGILATVAAGVALIGSRRWLALDRRPVFLLVFLAAALLPVSSMTGGTRYLYLASAATSLLAGLLCETLWARQRSRRLVIAGLVLVLAVSVQQLVAAGRQWRWASEMTEQGLTLMAGDRARCATAHVVLLTAPVGIGGVYCNFNFEGFAVATGCRPASFQTVLRAVREDVHVDIDTPAPGIVDLRVPSYQGTILASRDLSTFDEPVPVGGTVSIDTVLGRLQAWPDGAAERFRLTLAPTVAAPRLYYYSSGRIREAGAGG